MDSTERRVGSMMRRREDIPMDVVEEMLMRLPVKDVLRCKSLSKEYYAIIKKPRFINKHRFCSRSTKNKIITVIKKIGKGGRSTYNLCSVQSSSLSEVYAPTGAWMLLVGSSNGLVCAIFDHRVTKTIELWNPATREHRTIPNPPKFEPYCNHMGFGYDSVSDDYKLVMTSHNTPQVQWWSMKTNDWREIRIGPELVTKAPYITHHAGVSIRGKLYWLARIGENKRAIVSFDLVSNRFCLETVVPDAFEGLEIWCMNVVDFMGSIALSSGYNSSNPNPKIDIWVMKDCNKTWAKKFTIGPFPNCDGTWYPRTCTNGELLITKSLPSSSGFLLYDLIRNKKQLLLLPSELPDDHDHVSPPCSYYESLVSVPASNKHRVTNNS